MPSDRLAPRHRSATTRWTGHPPPLQQGTDQVRTSTGYTQGTATPDGARLFTLRGHDRRADDARRTVASDAEAREAAEQQRRRDCLDVVAWLTQLQRTLPRPPDGRREVRVMPTLYLGAAQLGAGWDMARLLRTLERLRDNAALDLELDSKGRRGAALRLAGSRLTLITHGFTGEPRFS